MENLTQHSFPYSDRNVNRLCIAAGATIRQAMVAIEAGHDRLCILVDDQGRLVKVISDGDIRRALIAGTHLDDPVAQIHNRRPVVIKPGFKAEDVQNLFSKRIALVPVVDDFGNIQGVIRQHDILPALGVKSREITIVGLGYVGLTLALVLADNGFSVFGYDKNTALLDKLRSKTAPFFEKGLQNYLDSHLGHNFRITSQLQGSNTDIYIITVGTPLDKATKQPNIQHLLDATREVGQVLKKHDLVVLRSTVPIGCTRKQVIPLLEEVSGLTAGRDFFVAFCPERTAEGRALEELRKLPQIVGGVCKQSTELATRLFSENTHTVIDVGSLEAAEMGKLLDNTFRDLVFAYSNQMALLAESLGVNLPSLVDKVNLGYTRNFIPKPSPGVGGPCLSKDPYIMAITFEECGVSAPLILAARQVNEYAIVMIRRRAEQLLAQVGKALATSTLFVVGFAFKGEPQTSDIRESTTVWLLDELRKAGGANIRGFDPIVPPDELRAIDIHPCSVADGFKDADVVFIMNNHRSYADWRILQLTATMSHPALVYDGWQTFSSEDMAHIPGVIYAGVGIG